MLNLQERFSSERFKALALGRSVEPGSITPSIEQAVLVELAAALSPCDVLEIGSYFADTTRKLAQVVAEYGGSVTTIDPFGDHRVPGIIAGWASSLQRVTTFYPECSMQFFARYERAPRGAVAPFNLVFVDGHHAFEYAFFDILASSRLLRPGGAIVVDNVSQAGPVMALGAFLDSHVFWTLHRQRGAGALLEQESFAGSDGGILLAPAGLEVGRIPQKFHIKDVAHTALSAIVVPIKAGGGILKATANLASFPYDSHLSGRGVVSSVRAAEASVDAGVVRLLFDPPHAIEPSTSEASNFIELELMSEGNLLIDTDRDLSFEWA